ncbi:MAG: polymer-forming cytoskeletal protein [Erysipelotrichaceae bacterium]
MKWYKKQSDWYNNQKDLYEKLNEDKEENPKDVSEIEQCEVNKMEDVMGQTQDEENTVNEEAIDQRLNDLVEEVTCNCEEPKTEAVKSTSSTIIDETTTIVGNIISDACLIVNGSVKGDIECTVDISVNGSVTGNIHCANAVFDHSVVHGEVKCDGDLQLTVDSTLIGNVKAKNIRSAGRIKGDVDVEESISLSSTSAILGDINTISIESDRGAVIQGSIMISQDIYIEE